MSAGTTSRVSSLRHGFSSTHISAGAEAGVGWGGGRGLEGQVPPFPGSSMRPPPCSIMEPSHRTPGKTPVRRPTPPFTRHVVLGTEPIQWAKMGRNYLPERLAVMLI